MRDIRTNTPADGYSDPNPAFDHLIRRSTVTVSRTDGQGTDTSRADRAALASYVYRFTRRGMTIVEVGVAANLTFALTATAVLTKAAHEADGRYIGIDLTDRTAALSEAPGRPIMLQVDSGSPAALGRLRDVLGPSGAIDFLFLDGNHSISAVLADWELTALLAPGACVGFHDTAYHPGPHLFTRALDPALWHVEPNVIVDPNDWGIGFAWRK